MKVWESPWIPISPTRPTRLNVPVVHPRMTVNDFTREDSKEWNISILEYFVAQENIPFIRSLAIR